MTAPAILLEGGAVMLPSMSRDEWGEQRKSYVTASDIATLALGRPGDWKRIREHKMSGDALVMGNKYARWGHIREPRLVEYAQGIEESIVPNNQILVRDRFSATPDGLGKGLVVECKTTKYEWADIPDNHYNQMQWQMLVTGFTKGLFVWEERLDDNRGWFRPGYCEHLWVERDERCIGELIEVAELFLSGGDPDW